MEGLNILERAQKQLGEQSSRKQEQRKKSHMKETRRVCDTCPQQPFTLPDSMATLWEHSHLPQERNTARSVLSLLCRCLRTCSSPAWHGRSKEWAPSGSTMVVAQWRTSTCSTNGETTELKTKRERKLSWTWSTNCSFIPGELQKFRHDKCPQHVCQVPELLLFVFLSAKYVHNLGLRGYFLKKFPNVNKIQSGIQRTRKMCFKQRNEINL